MHEDRPSQDFLLTILRYDPESGKLFWRRRPLSMFLADKYPERQCRSWNAKYADREAFTADSGKGYRTGTIIGYGTMRAHHVIWCMVHGRWPDRLRRNDRDRMNNRLENLVEHRAIPIGAIGHRYEPLPPIVRNPDASY